MAIESMSLWTEMIKVITQSKAKQKSNETGQKVLIPCGIRWIHLFAVVVFFRFLVCFFDFFLFTQREKTPNQPNRNWNKYLASHHIYEALQMMLRWTNLKATSQISIKHTHKWIEMDREMVKAHARANRYQLIPFSNVIYFLN